MRIVRAAACVASCFALLLAASCASRHAETPAEADDVGESDETELDVASIASEAKVSLLHALHAALAAKPGDAVEAELEGSIEEGKREVEFEVMIVDGDGAVWEVTVDPATGKVSTVERETESDEVAEVVAKRTAAGREHLRLGGLLERGVKAAGGTAVKVSFRGPDAAGQATVKVLRDGDDHDVTLDARTGAVLGTK